MNERCRYNEIKQEPMCWGKDVSREGICDVSVINKGCEMGGEGKMKVNIEWV